MKIAFVSLTLLMINVASVQGDCCSCENNRVRIAKLEKSLSQMEVAIETLETKLRNLTSHANGTCPCKPQRTNVNSAFTAPVAASCKELYERNPSLKSQVYPLMFGSHEIPVYCHMGNFGCGDGGWTLAMKIDGNKNTFVYDSSLWTNKTSFNVTGGKTGFDKEETKLPSYWSTNFSKICLGVRIGKQINFLAINKQANSLYSLIADEKYRATALGRNTWKTLFGSAASLQYECNREGFNAGCLSHAKARIGIVSNNEFDCDSCDSVIGFGAWVSCINAAKWSPDNGIRDTRAVCYILVQ